MQPTNAQDNAAAPRHADEVFDNEANASMVAHGITRVRSDYFRYGEYRYSSLKDAIAEAERHPGRG